MGFGISNVSGFNRVPSPAARTIAFTAAHAIKGPSGRADTRPVSPAVTADALGAVRRLSFAALEAQQPREIEAALAAELIGLFSVDQVHIARVAQDGTMARGTKFVPVAGAERDWAFPFDGPSGVKHVLDSGEPLHVPDAADSPVVSRPMIDRFGLASLFYVPLAFEGEVRSVAIICSEAPREIGMKSCTSPTPSGERKRVIRTFVSGK